MLTSKGQETLRTVHKNIFMCLFLYFVAVEKVLKEEHRIEGVLFKVNRLSEKRRPTSNEVNCNAYSMHVSRNERSFALRFMIYFMTYLTVFFLCVCVSFFFLTSGLFVFHSVLFCTVCEFVCLFIRQYKETFSHMLHSRSAHIVEVISGIPVLASFHPSSLPTASPHR